MLMLKADALHTTCFRGCEEVQVMLAWMGADVNAYGALCGIALQDACWGGHGKGVARS